MKLEKVLQEYGIEAKVVKTLKGPTVTTHEIEVPIGMKIGRVVGLSEELALWLEVPSVRVYRVPKSNRLAIEVPNEKRSIVESKISKKPGICILGQDMKGKEYSIDINKAPHLLISGSTGSGKSVLVTNIIDTLLEQGNEMILIDPKRVEFSKYENVRNARVVTDMSDCCKVLSEVVDRMEERYDILSKSGCRDLTEYNAKNVHKLSRVYVVIDELADLVMTDRAGVESNIVRIAQKARASGIHIIVCTQRPDANVLSGLIRTNIPSRICLKVMTRIDAEIALGRTGTGAEKLLGYGDALVLMNGMEKEERIQVGLMDALLDRK